MSRPSFRLCLLTCLMCLLAPALAYGQGASVRVGVVADAWNAALGPADGDPLTSNVDALSSNFRTGLSGGVDLPLSDLFSVGASAAVLYGWMDYRQSLPVVFSINGEAVPGLLDRDMHGKRLQAALDVGLSYKLLEPLSVSLSLGLLWIGSAQLTGSESITEPSGMTFVGTGTGTRIVVADHGSFDDLVTTSGADVRLDAFKLGTARIQFSAITRLGIPWIIDASSTSFHWSVGAGIGVVFPTSTTSEPVEDDVPITPLKAEPAEIARRVLVDPSPRRDTVGLTAPIQQSGFISAVLRIAVDSIRTEQELRLHISLDVISDTTTTTNINVSVNGTLIRTMEVIGDRASYVMKLSDLVENIEDLDRLNILVEAESRDLSGLVFVAEPRHLELMRTSLGTGFRLE